METGVNVVVKLVGEIQTLIKQNEELSKQTSSLISFVGSLQTALSPLSAFDSLPYNTQVSIQGNISLLISTLETLKRTLTTIKKEGFTVRAAKWLEKVQKMETDLRNILKALQVNWELMSTLNQESKFSALRLLSNPAAKRFWTTHFGAENKYADWTDFKHTLEEVLSVKDAQELGLLEAALSKEGKVSVYTLDTLTRIDGVPAAFWKTIYSDKPEKAKVVIAEECNQVDVLHSKLLALLENSSVKIQKNAAEFMSSVPQAVTAEIEKQFPDAGLKRKLIGSVSAKKLQEVASKKANTELTTWLQEIDHEVQSCINEIVMALQFALADGLCQRALSVELMEARVTKITTHMTQKGFVSQIIDNVQLIANSKIKENIEGIQAVGKSDSATDIATTGLQSLTISKEDFGKQIQAVVKDNMQEVLRLMYLLPLKRMLEKSFDPPANN